MIVKLNFYFTNQLKKFITVGITSVFIDLIVYYLLLTFSLKIPIAKFISFFCGTIYSYKINKNWTFNTNGGIDKFLKYLFIYSLSLAINVFFNSLVLSIFRNLNFCNFFTFFNFISAVFNFLF